MTAIALRIRTADILHACRKNGFAIEDFLPIMAGTTMEALSVAASIDTCGFRLHGKADIDMAYSASELRSVQPMIEYDCTRLGLRVIVKNHLAILGWLRCGFRQIHLT
jgi:hypothetical protein